MQTVKGFSPDGPRGNGGDAWQTAAIGYTGADAPKNIGEEYRRNLPMMYYAYNAQFLGYFGLAGTTNIDAAFALMNGVFNGQTNNLLYLPAPTNNALENILGPVTNLDNYSTGFSEFPLDSQQINYQAQALGLFDLKSLVVYLLVWQMGLTSPEAYVWTLHDRYQPPGTTCPAGTEYLVVQRNFDTLTGPIEYSSYVNGTLYTFYIDELCPPNNPLAVTVPFPVDFFADAYTSVAGQGLNLGGFYTGLTRDDLMGLRYLMSTNTVNIEAAGAGAQLLVTNLLPLTLLQTLPINLLSPQTLIGTDPVTLQALFTNLTIVSFTSNYVTATVPSVTAYFTNPPPPYTNLAGAPFNSWSPVQYQTNQVLITTLSFADFLAAMQTNDPATLQGLYPNLLISSVNTNFFDVLLTTNVTAFFTNSTGAVQYQTNQVLVTTLSFGDFLSAIKTNDPVTLLGLYPNLDISSVNTNFIGYGAATNVTPFFTNLPPPYTNLAGAPFNSWSPVQYQTNQVLVTTLSFGNFLGQIQTNDPVTLQGLYPNLLISSVNTNFLDVGYATNVTAFFTNLPPPYTNTPPPPNSILAGNYTVPFTNWSPVQYGNQQLLTTFSLADFLSLIQTNDPATLTALYPGLVFSSVITNYFTVLVTTNITPYFTNQPGPSVTNYEAFPGELWTNYDLALFSSLANTSSPAVLQALYPNLDIVSASGYFTNLITTNYIDYLTTQIGAPAGSPLVVVTVPNGYNNNIVVWYNYVFGNIVTNTYSNSRRVTFQNIYETNLVGSPIGSPLKTNVVNTVVTYPNMPSGDFFLVPTNWCGYNVLIPNLIQPFEQPFASYTNTVAGAVTNGFGVLQYTLNYIGYYTNRIAVVQAGFCEPVLRYATNYTTSIVTAYQYSFLNIVTNTYYTNSYFTITITNIAPTNGATAGNLVTNITTTTVVATNQPSGDFWIVPTTWCGYQQVELLTNVVSTTNTIVATSVSNAVYSVTTVSQYTNHTFAIRPGVCEQALAFATNYSTNIFTQYRYTFFNVYTNSYSPGTYQTVSVTNIEAYTNGLVGQLTNTITTSTFFNTNQPSGDFWIVPTTWCGFQQVGLLTSVAFTTNILTTVNGPGTIGQQYSVTTVSQYTNHTLAIRPGVCEQALAFATNYTTSFVTNYQYTFVNVLTNSYYPGTYQTVLTTNIEAVTNGLVGQLTNSITAGTFFNTNLPSGDFWIVPTNWCGYQSLTLVTNQVLTTNTLAATPGGSIGQQYSVTTVSAYTNHTFAIRPGVCQSVLAFQTNVTASIITQYQYTFFNVFTNSYYTNTFETVITTNTQTLINGLVGQVTNIVTTNSFYANVPSGDFWIVPTTWCGFQEVVLLTNLVFATNTFTAANTGTLGQQYSVTTISQYTNHTLAIRPGVCVPALAFATNSTTSVVTQYHYNFGNVVVNPTSFSTNGSETIITINLEPVTNGLFGQLTNTTTTANVVLTNAISGDFFIIPPNWCGYTIIATQLVTTVYSTNLITATNLPGINDIGQQYSVTTISSFSNYTFVVQPQICSLQTAAPALREGIQRIQFIRANFDSLLGQFFQPLTNDFTMTKVTNSQQVVEYYQRVITAPDFLFSASDQASGPQAVPTANIWTATVPNFSQANILPGLAGPGIINPQTTITFDKVGAVYFNGPLSSYTTLNTSPFLNQGTQPANSVIAYGSFDGSTNAPIVYPSGTSIQNLQNSILIQVSPPTLPDGTNGVPYPATTFSATGGQPPFTWSIQSGSLPANLTLTAGTISGTPNTPAGTYDFVVRLTDSVNRVVTLGYSITIH